MTEPNVTEPTDVLSSFGTFANKKTRRMRTSNISEEVVKNLIRILHKHPRTAIKTFKEFLREEGSKGHTYKSVENAFVDLQNQGKKDARASIKEMLNAPLDEDGRAVGDEEEEEEGEDEVTDGEEEEQGEDEE